MVTKEIFPQRFHSETKFFQHKDAAHSLLFSSTKQELHKNLIRFRTPHWRQEKELGSNALASAVLRTILGKCTFYDCTMWLINEKKSKQTAFFEVSAHEKQLHTCAKCSGPSFLHQMWRGSIFLLIWPIHRSLR